MTNNYTLLTLEQWEDQYSQCMEFDHDLQEEVGPLTFETYEPYISDLLKYAEELAKDHDSKPYQHIWTIVNGDDGKMIALNGWHTVNRIMYTVCSIPWGDGTDNDKDLYIEVDYEGDY